MRKLLLIIVALCGTLYSCNNKENRINKTFTESIYDAINQDGEWTKGDLNTKFEIGFYPNGSQKYFIGFEGYGDRYGDTTFYECNDLDKYVKVEEKPYIYHYRGDSLFFIQKKVNDTIFDYETSDLKNPSYYRVYDSDGKESVQYAFLFREKKVYLEWILYDKNKGNFESLMLDETYPSDYELREMSELEKNVFVRNSRKHYFKEWHIEYYD